MRRGSAASATIICNAFGLDGASARRYANFPNLQQLDARQLCKLKTINVELYWKLSPDVGPNVNVHRWMEGERDEAKKNASITKMVAPNVAAVMCRAEKTTKSGWSWCQVCRFCYSNVGLHFCWVASMGTIVTYGVPGSRCARIKRLLRDHFHFVAWKMPWHTINIASKPKPERERC